MNKQEFVKNLSSMSNLSQRKCNEMLNNAHKIICDNLRIGEPIEFKGFGKFFVKKTKERVVKNVYTKSLTFLTPKNVVCFKISTNLKSIVK